jgi:adenosylcobinamide-GDP ribazoletransferase
MSSTNELNKQQDKKIWKISGIFGLISFSTILPINIHTTIKEMAVFTWIWPFIGGLIGIIVGAFGFLILDLLHLPIIIGAALIYSFSIWFTGFHHLDGLVDFGDGMMVHGSPEKKIEVMRDKRIGTGGIAYLFMIGIITFAAIGSSPAILIFYILLVSEISAKIGIITCATFSKPFPDGTGRYFIESMNKKLLLLSFILASAIGFLIFNMLGLVGVTMGLLSGVIIALIAKKNFTWATGDVLGASNEVARMLALVIMVTLFTL